MRIKRLEPLKLDFNDVFTLRARGLPPTVEFEEEGRRHRLAGVAYEVEACD
jgi:hypothetical protein